MKKFYRLKPWDEVTEHHFISREKWDALSECESLDIEDFGDTGNTVLVVPTGVPMTFSNVRAVKRTDLYEVEEKTTPPTESIEKTYTKNDIRVAGALAMGDIENEDDAIVSAIAIAKLINKLN